ncbi:rhomboid family intramembrane serine protease [Teredinibacter haidensis]|uniref:rhomboid family intramembrane serine protease n=1 Tax=Teredinibacter haidensis TaxID=2731755 RepID=UPI000948C467|nr:rhomboid family intramembrane serine protease [Teredinibacter haidensis]
MNWTKIAEFPANTQLQHLNQFLLSHQVKHRITEQAGQQILWLADSTQAQFVTDYFKLVERGEEPPKGQKTAAAVPSGGVNVKQSLKLFPLTLATITLGFFGYLLIAQFYNASLVSKLLFLPLQTAAAKGEIWRILSPTFLHFDLLHILFNGLWIWELGRRIEVFAGKRSYLTIFLVTAVGANYVQFYMASGNLFGGLSGVVYAFLGYLLVWGWFHSSPLVKMPSGVYIFMLSWLALGFLGIIDQFISGQVANGAHLGGLILGIVVAAIEVFIYRKKIQPS